MAKPSLEKVPRFFKDNIQKKMSDKKVIVVGGGFAGCESAWACANSEVQVALYEMRPAKMTPAHKTHKLAELVCSNSFKSKNPDSPSGLLKQEMQALGSLMVPTAFQHSVPGGEALSVDREKFADEMTHKIENHPLIEVRREEFSIDKVKNEKDVCAIIIATGPLTSDSLSKWIFEITGKKHLYFYDAVSPTIEADSINREIAWEQSRYDKGDAGYLNCPMNREEYEKFVDELLKAEKAPLHDFEKGKYFEGCMPIEEIAERGRNSLAFGNFKPVGLTNPRTGKRAYVVVQLRPENRERTLYSMVGCQTRMKWGEQKRVFRMIPGLEEAEFVRYGVIHRNTYLDSPRILNSDFSFKKTIKEFPDIKLFFAGQITGVEGYLESGASGLLAGHNAARIAKGLPVIAPPRQSAYGCLIAHVTNDAAEEFSPMNINWGLFPTPPEQMKDKQQMRSLKLKHARDAFRKWLEETTFAGLVR